MRLAQYESYLFLPKGLTMTLFTVLTQPAEVEFEDFLVYCLEAYPTLTGNQPLGISATGQPVVLAPFLATDISAWSFGRNIEDGATQLVVSIPRDNSHTDRVVFTLARQTLQKLLHGFLDLVDGTAVEVDEEVAMGLAPCSKTKDGIHDWFIAFDDESDDGPLLSCGHCNADCSGALN